jgi:uncharacterized protein YciI
MVISFFVFNQFITAQTVNPDYDSTLAQKLGADDYGMKSYVFVILKTGSNTTTDKAFVDSCFAGHMANINRLVNEGKLFVAGPFGKNNNAYRGLFILNVKNIEEAQEIVQTDPAINSKLLDADLYSWYGSAALPEYLEAALKIGKYKIN